MPYELRFLATDDADWSEGIELLDDSTNGPLADADGAEFELNVVDCGSALLTASTTAGTIQKPSAHIITWQFTPAQLAALETGRTYKGGITMATNGGTTQLAIFTLAFIDGGLA